MAAATVRAGGQEPERQASLQAANEAWAHWREAECAYQSDSEYGGSGVQVDFVRCAAALTADRAISFLRAQRSGD